MSILGKLIQGTAGNHKYEINNVVYKLLSKKANKWYTDFKLAENIIFVSRKRTIAVIDELTIDPKYVIDELIIAVKTNANKGSKSTNIKSACAKGEEKYWKKYEKYVII